METTRNKLDTPLVFNSWCVMYLTLMLTLSILPYYILHFYLYLPLLIPYTFSDLVPRYRLTGIKSSLNQESQGFVPIFAKTNAT